MLLPRFAAKFFARVIVLRFDGERLGFAGLGAGEFVGEIIDLNRRNAAGTCDDLRIVLAADCATLKLPAPSNVTISVPLPPRTYSPIGCPAHAGNCHAAARTKHTTELFNAELRMNTKPPHGRSNLTY